MKLLPLILLVLFTLPLACKPVENHAAPPTKEKTAPLPSDPKIPLCEIDKLDSCDVEAVGPTETVYRCNHCGVQKNKCPDCKGHTCDNCSTEPCRCRLKNKK